MPAPRARLFCSCCLQKCSSDRLQKLGCSAGAASKSAACVCVGLALTNLLTSLRACRDQMRANEEAGGFRCLLITEITLIKPDIFFVFFSSRLDAVPTIPTLVISTRNRRLSPFFHERVLRNSQFSWSWSPRSAQTQLPDTKAKQNNTFYLTKKRRRKPEDICERFSRLRD